MRDLEKAVLATLVYYDVLERPLTGWEVFKYLIRSKGPVRLDEVLAVLENSSKIEQKNGFYFLKSREKIIKERIERQKIADQKWKKARHLIKLLQWIPYIRLVVVSGSLAMNNPKPESDIDLLIVTKAGRIWTCRGLITLFVRLLGQYRHSSLTKDRLCLNHYLTDQSLKIPFKSLYNAQTYAHLRPMLDIECLTGLFEEANQWIGKIKQGYLNQIKPNRFLGLLRKIQELLLDTQLGNGIELFLKRFQEQRIKKDPLTYQAGGRVVFSDEQLEFHPDSPEKWVLEKYNQKMKKIGLNEMAQEKDSGLTI